MNWIRFDLKQPTSVYFKLYFALMKAGDFYFLTYDLRTFRKSENVRVLVSF